jgi:hypothetical protein
MELKKLKQVISEIENRKTFEAILDSSKEVEKNPFIRDSTISLCQEISFNHFPLFELDKEELEYLNKRNKDKLCALQNSLACLE